MLDTPTSALIVDIPHARPPNPEDTTCPLGKSIEVPHFVFPPLTLPANGLPVDPTILTISLVEVLIVLNDMILHSADERFLRSDVVKIYVQLSSEQRYLLLVLSRTDLTAVLALNPRLPAAVSEIAFVIRAAKALVKSLITVLSLPSSSAFASNMFSTTRGRRPPRIIRQRFRGSKSPPLSRSSQKVFVIPEKSKDTSGVTNSMSKATICCFKMRRCLRRKSCPSIDVALAVICEAA